MSLSNQCTVDAMQSRWPGLTKSVVSDAYTMYINVGKMNSGKRDQRCSLNIIFFAKQLLIRILVYRHEFHFL